MSFFFTDDILQNVKQTDKLLKLAKTHSCLVCPLSINKKNKINPIGTIFPIIYILTETNYTKESEEYTLLHQILKKVFGNDYKEICRFNTTIACSAIDDTETSILEAECCFYNVKNDIIASKPIVIIGLGNIPLQLVCNQTSMDMCRGRKFPIKINNHECWYFPTYSITDLIKRRNKWGKSSLDFVINQDIKNIFNFVQHAYLPPTIIETDYDKGITCVSAENPNYLKIIENKLKQFQSYEYVAIDIETTGLSPYHNNTIISCAIGTDEDVLSFEVTPDILPILKDFLLHSKNKIFHNSKFDLEWLITLLGTDIIYNTQYQDTMSLAYILDERSSKQKGGSLSLGFLTQINFGFNIKQIANIDRGNLGHESIQDTLLYNGKDVKYTFKLFFALQAQLDDSLHDSYNNLCITGQMLALTQHKGVLVDKRQLIQYEKNLTEELADIVTTINNLDEVKKYILLYNNFNPGSPDHVKKLLTKVLQLSLNKRTETTIENDIENTRYSTDASVLQYYEEQGIRFCGYILKYREVLRVKSNCIDPIFTLLDKDNILRTQFNHCFTSTGRLCVAKGTFIQAVRDFSKFPNGISIEDIKINDLVYTYNENKQLTIKKVVWTGQTGIKKVIRIHWKGQGGQHKGFLDVTPEHEIRLINGSYKKAKDLNHNERVLALHTSTKSNEDKFIYSNCVNNHIIDKIEYLPDKVPVYDIEVEDTHNFIANEICVHNSSQQVNLQNMPRRKRKYIRNIIVAPEGYKIVAADLGQIEPRVVAMFSKDKNFCEKIRKGYDIHKEWTLRLAEIYPAWENCQSKEYLLENLQKLKDCRDIIKNKFSLPLSYGSSYLSIAQNLKIPEPIAQQLYNEYWAEFSGVKKWQDSLLKFYEKYGYIETLFGRRRHAPLQKNEILNSSVQGTAAEITIRAMNRLSQYAIKSGNFQFQPVLNIHDDITSIIPIQSLEHDVELIAKEMCNPCFDFINVPLTVEVSIGDKWGALEKYKEFITTQFIY